MLKYLPLVLLVLLLTGYFFVSWSLSNRILSPNSSYELTESRIKNNWGSTVSAQLAPLPPPQNFSVASKNNPKVNAQYFQRPDTAQCLIIMAHGWSDTWLGMLRYTKLFTDCACDYVLYDHRAHGNSGGEFPTAGVLETEDLIALTEWAEQKGFPLQQIAWVGASWGAASVLQAGAADKNVAFIMADSPFQDWESAIFERAIKEYGAVAHFLSWGVMNTVGWRTGVNYKEASPLLAASKIEEPVFLIHSKMDSQTASTQSVNIAAQLNPKNSVFHHSDWGSDHTRDILLQTEKYKSLVMDFVAKEAPTFGKCGE